MTAPTIIESLIEAAKSEVIISSNGGNDYGFPMVIGGVVKDGAKQGTIVSIKPFRVEDSSGNIMSAPFTPLYPIFYKGSVIKAVEKISNETMRFPAVILDTLGRSESEEDFGYLSYNARLFAVMDAKAGLYNDQYDLYFDQGLAGLAEWVIDTLKEKRFINESKVHRPLWGDSDQYGNNGKDILSLHTNAYEITGDFLFHSECDLEETNETKYNVTFNVADQNTLFVENALITISGLALNTNSQGVATLSLSNGDYPYTVEKVGYTTSSGTITISNSVVLEEVTLQRVANLVTFTIVDLNDAPVEGAQIVFNGEIKLTDINGQVSYTAYNGAYYYEITKEGYVTANGVANVSGETIINRVISEGEIPEGVGYWIVS